MLEGLGNPQGTETLKFLNLALPYVKIIKKQTNKIPHVKLPKYQ